MRLKTVSSVIALCAGLAGGGANAGVWTEDGNAGLRSDIELLQSVGLLDSIATQWPLPWGGILARLNDSAALSGQPDYILAAVKRVREQGRADMAPGTFRSSLVLDATTSPAVVRGFDALGRQPLLAQASMEYVGSSTVVHLNMGARSTSKGDRQVFDPDGSYIAQRINNTVVYAGYLTHWWGPGWMSALSLSNNARPVPQVGITRASTKPFESPWLSWIGPWQFEFFVGVLDGPRVARNTIYDGTRIAVSPLPGLEIAASRTDMMCGTGHSCKPIAAYFNPTNDATRLNGVNDEATLEGRYTGSFHSLHYAAYIQLMNEDTNIVTDSSTSHLFGASLWHPVAGGTLRVTFEYTDTTPSWNMFGGAAHHGYVYTNFQYADGMHYRGRTLGASLDTDSRLISLQGAFTDRYGVLYTATYHRVRISDPLNLSGNVVSAVPVSFNEGLVRVSVPLNFSTRQLRFDIEGRVQDDQPRPDHGAQAAVEAALRMDL